VSDPETDKFEFLTRAYRASFDERREIGYVGRACPSDVYRYLEQNWVEPKKGVDNSFFTTNRSLLEYVLLRRKHTLIDYALARFGYSLSAIQKAYDRGDVGTRLAALANPRGGPRLKQVTDVLIRGKYTELNALLQNPYLPSSFMSDLFSRRGCFSHISDENFLPVVYAIGRNERLSQPYSSVYIDGFADHSYSEVFSSAWKLTKVVPANQQWAGALYNLLWNTIKPSNFYGVNEAGVDEVIERWRIDSPPKSDPPRWYERSSSFYVRSLLADLLPADENLLKADDPALRMSFYRRFPPKKFNNWPEFLEKDSSEFVNAGLENYALWSSAEERSKLNRVCLAAPDPTGSIINDFASKQVRFKKLYPEWFAEDNSNGKGLLHSVESKLTELTGQIAAINAKKVPERFFSWPWWVWVAIGAFLMRAFH
jgi:hypothetical protein